MQTASRFKSFQENSVNSAITPDLHTGVPGGWDRQTKLHFRLEPSRPLSFYHVSSHPVCFLAIRDSSSSFRVCNCFKQFCKIILSRLLISMEAFDVHIRLCGAGG